MTEHMVAIFDTEGAADAAARDLESAGFPPQSIRRYRADSARPSSGSAAGAADPAPSDGGFWGWLLGDEGDTTRAAYGRDEEWYNRSVGTGKTVLSVTVYEDSRIHEAATILESHHPIEIEENTTEGSAFASSADGTASASSAVLGSAHGEGDAAQARTSVSTGTEEVIPLAEENLQVGKRTIDRGTTRIRRYVVETPVEREVTLHGERVTVERRTPATTTAGSLPGQFEERVVEVHESDEVPVVQKTAHVNEEVVIRREPTERTEKVRETVRREEVEITPDQPDHQSSR